MPERLDREYRLLPKIVTLTRLIIKIATLRPLKIKQITALEIGKRAPYPTSRRARRGLANRGSNPSDGTVAELVLTGGQSWVQGRWCSDIGGQG